MDGIALLILYLLGLLIVSEYYILQNMYPMEFIIFSAVFYPLIIAVWTLLFILALVSGVIYGIGDKIRIAKGRRKNAE